jgi:ectoine hydroxylase-related dioxygenase (phytanoyl-CoA dioxygenase family)
MLPFLCWYDWYGFAPLRFDVYLTEERNSRLCNAGRKFIEVVVHWRSCCRNENLKLPLRELCKTKAIAGVRIAQTEAKMQIQKSVKNTYAVVHGRK